MSTFVMLYSCGRHSKSPVCIFTCLKCIYISLNTSKPICRLTSVGLHFISWLAPRLRLTWGFMFHACVTPVCAAPCFVPCWLTFHTRAGSQCFCGSSVSLRWLQGPALSHILRWVWSWGIVPDLCGPLWLRPSVHVTQPRRGGWGAALQRRTDHQGQGSDTLMSSDCYDAITWFSDISCLFFSLFFIDI